MTNTYRDIPKAFGETTTQLFRDRSLERTALQPLHPWEIVGKK